MLLFAKALCYSLCLTSAASLSIFLMSLLGLQLQLEQPQLETSSRFFLRPLLIRCNCLSFSVLSTQLNPFVPRHWNINKVALSFIFVQNSYVRHSVLNGMVCLYIKTPQYFDPAILNYTCSFVIIQLNLAN